MNLDGFKARELVEITCSICNNKFLRTVRDVRRNIKFNRNFYCTKKCLYEAKTLRKEISCKECNTKFLGNEERLFCSKNCSATHNNRIVKRKSRNLCKNCGKECTKRLSLYCDNTCQQEFRYNKFVEDWLSGKDDGVRSNGIATCKMIKKYLIRTFGDKCSKCGWNEVHEITGKVPVQLDHKDGNSENNSRDNIRLLCPSCHSLTPTFGNLNRGKGRKNRRYAAVA